LSENYALSLAKTSSLTRNGAIRGSKNLSTISIAMSERFQSRQPELDRMRELPYVRAN
jgi:hypothetical protein